MSLKSVSGSLIRNFNSPGVNALHACLTQLLS
jgi:hypothetical protein